MGSSAMYFRHEQDRDRGEVPKTMKSKPVNVKGKGRSRCARKSSVRGSHETEPSEGSRKVGMRFGDDASDGPYVLDGYVFEPAGDAISETDFAGKPPIELDGIRNDAVQAVFDPFRNPSDAQGGRTRVADAYGIAFPDGGSEKVRKGIRHLQMVGAHIIHSEPFAGVRDPGREGHEGFSLYDRPVGFDFRKQPGADHPAPHAAGIVLDPSCPGVPDILVPVFHAGERSPDPAQDVDPEQDGEYAFAGPGTVFMPDNEEATAFFGDFPSPETGRWKFLGPVPKDIPGAAHFEPDLPIAFPIGGQDPDVAHGRRKGRQDPVGQCVLFLPVEYGVQGKSPVLILLLIWNGSERETPV